MADIQFACLSCNQSLEAPQEMAGDALACPQCSSPLTVPKQKARAVAVSIDMKACRFCGENILATAVKCKHCGEFLDGRKNNAETDSKSLMDFEARKKSAGLAAFLNLVIPGLGYMYCGNYVLGIAAFVFVVIVAIVTLGFGMLITVPIMIIDGVLCAGRANRKLAEKLGRK